MTETFETRFNALVQQTGALQQGHFQLASGRHGSRFFRCIKLLETPDHASFLFDALARQWADPTATPIDVVLGANEAGSILAFETARRLGAKVAIARQTDSVYDLIDGFALTANQRVLVVDDITTTGGTAKQLIRIIHAAGAVPVGVGLIATKGLFEVDLGCPTNVLITLEGMDAIAPDDCPLCRQQVPLAP